VYTEKGNPNSLGHRICTFDPSFAVEEVSEIARLDWNQVIAAENNSGNLVTSIARLDGNTEESRLAQVLDVEQILRDVLPNSTGDLIPENVGPQIKIPAGTVILAADDSPLRAA